MSMLRGLGNLVVGLLAMVTLPIWFPILLMVMIGGAIYTVGEDILDELEQWWGRA